MKAATTVDTALLAERRLLGQDVAYELAAIAGLLIRQSQDSDDQQHNGFLMRTIGARLDTLVPVIFASTGEYDHPDAIQEARRQLYRAHDTRGMT